MQPKQQSTAQFEAVFYGVAQPVVIFKGPNMVYEMFNEAYGEIYAGRKLLGLPILEAVPELKSTPFPEILKRVYETGETYISREGLALLFNNKKGRFEERYFDTHFSRISYGANEEYRVLATPREVTERVVFRQELEISLKELEAERELRDRFVSALSHDLRTPLALIKAGAQIIKRKTIQPEEVNKLSDKIVLNINRADRMIRDLLDANRLKAGKTLAISVTECRMDLIIEHVIGELEELYGKRFSFENKSGEVYGYWDSLSVHRILENLTSNAIKYGLKDGLITIVLDSNQSDVFITVHNEGNPIPDFDQHSLFDLYDRTITAETGDQSGWGVGLNLVKGLCESHGGSVSVKSSADEGTSFIVSLPNDSRSN